MTKRSRRLADAYGLELAGLDRRQQRRAVRRHAARPLSPEERLLIAIFGR